MKANVAGMGSLVAAVAAVAGSVALSLLILHPPSESLLPWSAPAERGHVAAVILPAAHPSQPVTHTPVERPVVTPAEVALTPAPKTARPTVHRVPPQHRKPSPPPPTPPPVSQPVTTPVTTPPVTTPAVTTNNGRWSAAAKVKSWQGAAAKQATRTQKGKPAWAGPKHVAPAAPPAPAPVPAPVPTQAAPEAAATPPGQAKKTTTPPGQAKKTP